MIKTALKDSLKILLVEDNPGDALLIKEALKESSYGDATLYVAESISDAIKFSDKNIILVLLDLSLPDSNGVDTVRRMREHFPGSALIVLTGLDDEKVSVEALREGAQNYLNKNEIETKILDKSIRFSLERHQIIQKLVATEKELIQSKFSLEKAQEVAHMGSWEADLIKETAEWSDETQRIFGLKPGEFDGKASTFFAMVHPLDSALINNEIQNASAEKRLFNVTHRIVRKSGEGKWVLSQAEIIFNESGIAVKLIGSIQDVTEMKEAEEKITKANRLYSFISHINQTIVHAKDEQILFDKVCTVAIEQGLFKASWIGLLDENGLLKMVSIQGDEAIIKELKKYSGLDYSIPPLNSTTTGQVLATGRHVMKNDIQNDSAMQPFKEIFIQLGIKAIITFPITKSGKVIGVFGFHSARENFFDEEETALLDEAAGDISFALDVFEKGKQRLISEKNLERSEARLKEAQEIALVGSWEIDIAHNILYWSDEQYKILGFKNGHVTPSNELFLSMVHPEDAERVNKQFNNTFQTLVNSSSNFKLLLGDGIIKHTYCEWKFEFDKNKNPARIYGIVQDITPRKLAEEEREKIIGEIIQRNKDLEQFAYIISHNLRLPVANIIGYAEVLKDDVIDENLKAEFMDAMLTSVKNLDEVVSDLSQVLQVRREIIEKKEQVNFSQLIGNIRDSIYNIIEKENVKIICDFTAVDIVTTLKSYMYSVFYNLISNSIKYRQKDVTPVIEIKSRLDQNKIVLTFKDNGTGIDLVKNKDTIFGMYKRFHSQIEGKGMGLFMVKTQVETLGGRISVKSEVNKGTEFRIEFEKSQLN